MGLILVVHSCKKEEVPTLTTVAVSNITEISAQSGGNVTSDGGAEITTRGIVWGKTQNPTIETNNGLTTSGVGLGLFQADLTGLEGNTDYYVRAFASNKAGTAYGNQQKFKTSLVEKATVVTESASDITTSSAIVGGTITMDGGSIVTERGIYWGDDQNPETTGIKVQIGSGTGTFSYQITNLTVSTTYYVKAYAKNIKGEALGNQASFSTLPLFPSITTTTPSIIASFFSIIGGNVTSDGGATVSERGIYWGNSQNPESTGTKVSAGSGLGLFSIQLTTLSANTNYYYKAYAKNSRGTTFGNQVTFTTNLTIKDVENNEYGFVKINNNWWFTEDLKTTKYRNGDLIGTTIPATLDISSEITPKYQWAYDGTESNVPIYGRLYTGFVVLDARGICPTGWHVPSDSDWGSLITYLGGENVAGGKLKETGLSHWNSPNTGATNEFGFTALPGGMRDNVGPFVSLGNYANWQTSTNTSNKLYQLSNGNATIAVGSTPRYYGRSVRCVKD